MKKLLNVIALILTSQFAFAQKDALQLDERNKYVYYQVVDKQGLIADTFFKRGLSFVKASSLKVKDDNKANNTLTAKGKFFVYNGSSVVRKEAGEITYTFFVETKDDKYRYKISDLIFTPYTRDRFGNMVPVPGIAIALEKLSSKYSSKETDNYTAQAGTFCKATGDNLKSQMDKNFKISTSPSLKKISTDKW